MIKMIELLAETTPLYETLFQEHIHIQSQARLG
jgi:hypothetical protein